MNNSQLKKKKKTLSLPAKLFDYNTATSVQQHIGGSQHISCDEMETLRPGIEEWQLCTSLNI